MSQVTNIILIVSNIESDETINQINSFDYDTKVAFKLVGISNSQLPKGWYGGDKYFEATVLIGAFNYLPLDKFIIHLKENVNYEDKFLVQLIVKEEHDERFKIIYIFD